MTVPDHGDDMYLEFKATATDSSGFSTTKSFNLPMDEHTISVAANVPGVPIDLNTGELSTPFSGKAVTNSVNRLSAPVAFGGLDLPALVRRRHRPGSHVHDAGR